MLSTILIFKWCKFSVNLWTLCFVLQKVTKSFKFTMWSVHLYPQTMLIQKVRFVLYTTLWVLQPMDDIQTGPAVVNTPSILQNGHSNRSSCSNHSKRDCSNEGKFSRNTQYLFIFVKIAGRADFALFQNLLSICSDCTSTIL